MKPKALQLTIKAIPPSNNKYLGKGGKKNVFDYQNEKKRWVWLIKAAVGRNKPKEPYAGKCKVSILYYFPNRIPRDPDNYSGKFILDGLQVAGIIENDSFWHIKLDLDADVDKDNPRTIVTIEPLTGGE